MALSFLDIKVYICKANKYRPLFLFYYEENSYTFGAFGRLSSA